jgi:putative hydrolase of the HAD superfamily
MSRTYRVILFDLDDTLIDRTAAGERYARDLVERYPDVFSPGRRDEHLARLLAIDLERTGDRQGYCRAMAEAYPALGDPERVWQDFVTRLPLFVSARPSVENLLRVVRTRHLVGLVSNGTGTLQRAKLARAGLADRFDAIVISGEIGAEKPDRRIFLGALKALGAAPHEALMVGDDPARDVAGAVAAGLDTVWIDRTWRRRGLAYPQTLPKPRYVLDRVEELVTLLPSGR